MVTTERLDVIVARAALADPQVVSTLRTTAGFERTPLEVAQVRRVVDMLRAGWYARETIEAATGLDTDELCQLVVDLGVWLAQSVGGTTDVDIVAPDEATPATVAETGVTAGRRRRPADNQLVLFPQHTANRVVRTWGLGRPEVTRDVSKALRTIVCVNPDDTTVTRWLLRRNHRSVPVVTYPTVATLHKVAQFGRLDDLGQLVRVGGTVNATLAGVLVGSFDLLEVSRSDACAALAELVAGAVPSERLVRKAGWVDDDLGRRLRAALDDNRQLDAVRRRLACCSAAELDRYAPAHIGALNDGQVRRLAEQAGLDVTGTDHHLEVKVRAAIDAAGLNGDADQLVVLGVRSAQLGLWDSFVTALGRRADADLGWEDDLHAQLVERDPLLVSAR
jgi:hypothetical protein